MQLDIVTPQRIVFSEQVEMVALPGTEGELGVLPGHATLFSTLEIGEVLVRAENQEYSFAISGGVVQVNSEKIVVLADAAELAIDIEIERAESAKAKAEQQIQGLSKDDPQYAEAEAVLKRATNRVNVAKKKY